jgi:hypothetical protein
VDELDVSLRGVDCRVGENETAGAPPVTGHRRTRDDARPSEHDGTRFAGDT